MPIQHQLRRQLGCHRRPRTPPIATQVMPGRHILSELSSHQIIECWSHCQRESSRDGTSITSIYIVLLSRKSLVRNSTRVYDDILSQHENRQWLTMLAYLNECMYAFLYISVPRTTLH